MNKNIKRYGSQWRVYVSTKCNPNFEKDSLQLYVNSKKEAIKKLDELMQNWEFTCDHNPYHPFSYRTPITNIKYINLSINTGGKKTKPDWKIRERSFSVERCPPYITVFYGKNHKRSKSFPLFNSCDYEQVWSEVIDFYVIQYPIYAHLYEAMKTVRKPNKTKVIKHLIGMYHNEVST